MTLGLLLLTEWEENNHAMIDSSESSSGLPRTDHNDHSALLEFISTCSIDSNPSSHLGEEAMSLTAWKGKSHKHVLGEGTAVTRGKKPHEAS